MRRSFLSALLPGAIDDRISTLMNASNVSPAFLLILNTGCRRMGVEHLEGPVAAVVDHDIRFQMRQCRFALVAVRVEVEVDRQLEPQPVQTTDQALRIVGTVRCVR